MTNTQTMFCSMKPCAPTPAKTTTRPQRCNACLQDTDILFFFVGLFFLFFGRFSSYSTVDPHAILNAVLKFESKRATIKRPGTESHPIPAPYCPIPLPRSMSTSRRSMSIVSCNDPVTTTIPSCAKINF